MVVWNRSESAYSESSPKMHNHQCHDGDNCKHPHHHQQCRRHTLRSTKSFVQLPRLVNRDMPYHQSRNRISVGNERHHAKVWRLFFADWFHCLLRMPTYLSVPLLLAIWTAVILLFASIYVYIDTSNIYDDCGLGDPGLPITWGTSFAFSLETCTTVGYGLPGSTNAFFEQNCPSVQIAIYAQMTWSMMYNAFLFAFFYSVLAKCENRSVQFVFANKLCITVKDGRICVTTRCYDIDSKYPVVETHARMYVMDRKMQMHVLRLHDPNDELGGMLYASLPTEITHVVDHHSVLSPRKMPLIMSSHGLVLRGTDSHTGSRDEIVCPVCGEAYGTYERLQKHVRYNQLVEEREEYPPEHSHLGFQMPDITPISLEEVKDYIENSISEIVVVVEGIDPQVSGTFQSLQSYKYEDIVWEGTYEPCVSVRKNKFAVDLGTFHDIAVPASPPSSVNGSAASDEGTDDDAEKGLSPSIHKAADSELEDLCEEATIINVKLSSDSSEGYTIGSSPTSSSPPSSSSPVVNPLFSGIVPKP